jgi:Trypsin-co-occurring domain 2
MAADRIGLAETIRALRSELEEAMAQSAQQAVQFVVGPVQMEFHVGVTKDVNSNAKAKFWVLELDGSGSYSDESIEKVIMSLEPVGVEGKPVHVRRGYEQKP